jgi:hypothetical protein
MRFNVAVILAAVLVATVAAAPVEQKENKRWFCPRGCVSK